VQGAAVSSTQGRALTAGCSSSEATQVSSSATSDLVSTSSSEHGDVHIVVDKQTPAEGTTKSDSSINIVVDDKMSSSRVIRTVVS